MAFVGMVLAIILLGIYELLSMFNSYNALVEATRDGSRIVSLNYPDTQTIDTVMQSLDKHGLNTITNGQCDISELDIYEAMDRGNCACADTYAHAAILLRPGYRYLWRQVHRPQSGYCPPFDQSDRNDLAIAQQGTAPATVGLRVNYTYHYKTPVLSVAGASRTFSVSTVMPLGGDDAGNFQDLAVVNPPAPPPAPGQPGPVTVTSPGMCAPSTVVSPTVIQLTGSITTSGIISGTRRISGSQALGYTRSNPLVARGDQQH